MDTFWILAALVLFGPAIWLVASRVWRTPETVPTPAWLAAANALFIFAGPFIVTVLFGDPAGGRGDSTANVVYVTCAYYLALAVVYGLLWRGFFGPLVGVRRGLSAIGTLKGCLLAARPRELLVLGAVVLAISLTLNVLYAVNISGGSDYFKMARLPYPVVILNTLTTPATLGIVAAMSWLAASRQPVTVRLLAGAIALGFLGNTLAAGRRELLYFSCMVGLGILWSGRRRLGVAVPLVVAMAYVVLFVFAPVFLRARLIYSSANSPGVVEAFRRAAEEQRTAVVDETGEELADNMRWRFATLGFWQDMYQQHQPGEFEGKILEQGLIMVMPRAFVGFSKYRLGAVDEALLGTEDICNNIALESFLDIGYQGPLIYGVVLGMVMALGDFLLALTALRSRALAVLASSVLIRLLLGPEVNLISFFSDVRTVLIYCLLAAAVAILFGRRPLRLPGPADASAGRRAVRPAYAGLPGPAVPAQGRLA